MELGFYADINIATRADIKSDWLANTNKKKTKF